MDSGSGASGSGSCASGAKENCGSAKMNSWKKAVKAVELQQISSAQFLQETSFAVSSQNKPGEHMDLLDDSDPVRATKLVQEAILGGTSTQDGTVKAHNEESFARVRQHFGRSEEHYIHSLTERPLRMQRQEEAAGKSNAFFVYTENGRYCIKSVDPSEARILLRLSAEYEIHVLLHQDTFLPKFFGLYEARLERSEKTIWMMVQGNVLGGRSAVIQRFDLKGSTHGRSASAKERGKGQSSVFKDLDFVEAGCSLRGVNADAEQQWEHWVQIIETDARWLASQNLLDYSLLLGFSSCPREIEGEMLKKELTHVNRLELDPSSMGDLGTALPETDALVVYVGIVDCLMPYGWLKCLENLFCDALFSADISCQPPEKYASRFVDFVGKLSCFPEDLQEFTAKRQQAARRPLGVLVGEFGRKDVILFSKSPAALILLIAGLIALPFFFWRWIKWWGLLFVTVTGGIIALLCLCWRRRSRGEKVLFWQKTRVRDSAFL